MNSFRKRCTLCCALLLCVLSISAAKSQTGLTSHHKILDDFSYPDGAAARAVWQPIENSLPVEAVQVVAGRRALRLPVSWQGERRRATWQRELNLDLSRADAFRFQLYVDDVQKIASYLTLYFASGSGWYSASLAPRQGWQQVRLDKAQFGTEGTPAGWDKISAVRFGAWKPPGDAATPAQSTFMAFADLQFSISDVVIVLNSAAFAGDANEERGIRGFARDAVQILEKIGVEAGTLNDSDVEGGSLAGRRIAIFPYNPKTSERAVEQIEKFMAGGGKSLMFYSAPPRLLNALGLEAGKYTRRQREGQFASMRFDANLLPHVPERLTQNSWNITSTRPLNATGAIGKNARPVGMWFDEKGVATDEAALLVSDSGAFLTHVLLQDDATGREQLMLALVGHFAPEVWAVAAQKSLNIIGRVGEWNTLEDIEEAVTKSGRASAKQYLASARRLEARAKIEIAAKKLPQALQSARDARTQAQFAYAALQTSRANEMRAVWCHSAFGVDGMTWDEAIKTLSDSGLNMIMPNMLWGGLAYYPSEFLPVDESVVTRGDQIAQCVAAAKKYGVQTHIWKVNWNMTTAPKAFVEKMRAQNRTQQKADGTKTDWLCPSHPDNFILERDSMTEVARRYDIDGLHFDYIRYPDGESCYCDGCRSRFETLTKTRVANWPLDVTKGTLREPYLEFRRNNISRLVEAVSVEARRVKPKIKISAAVFSDWPDTRDSIGQDWVMWCQKGWLDFVCPMNYTSNPDNLDAKLARQMPALDGAVPLVSGIGVTLGDWQLSPDETIQQINVARKRNTAGWILFNYTSYVARTVLPALRQGLTAR